MEEWGGTGIIARIETPKLAEAIIATGLPFIALDLDVPQLAEGNPLANVCEVRSDSDNAIRLAVEHFTDRGFTQFAFVGKDDRIWSKRREEAFRKYVGPRRFHISHLPLHQNDAEIVSGASSKRLWPTGSRLFLGLRRLSRVTMTGVVKYLKPVARQKLTCHTRYRGYWYR